MKIVMVELLNNSSIIILEDVYVMSNFKHIDFQRCTSGIDFENWMVDLLMQLHIPARRVGKNDCGVDIIAEANWNNKKYYFYIQCKYHNKPIIKTPVQEIFAGTAHSKYYGRPVVITNNEATFETRRYANDLGVEIIAAPQWDEFEDIITRGLDSNPNPRDGLFGLMIASYLNNKDFIPKSLLEENEEKAKSNNELRFQILSEFDEAEECVKEAAYLQQKAAQFQQRALDIQKRALLRNLTYD